MRCPVASWIATSPAVVAPASLALIVMMMMIARFGLSVGKWVNNVGQRFHYFYSDGSDLPALLSRLPADICRLITHSLCYCRR